MEALARAAVAEAVAESASRPSRPASAERGARAATGTSTFSRTSERRGMIDFIRFNASATQLP